MKKILLASIIFISAYTVSYAQCTKPTVVQITSSNNSTITICEGTAFPLTGIAMVPASSLQGGFRYSWIKIAPTSSTLVQPTTIFTAPGQTLISIPSYLGITGQITDAGTYVLHVEDGLTGNPTCYSVATVVINVTPAAMPTVSLTATATTICEGMSVTFTASPVNGGTTPTYQWRKGSVNIASATNATYTTTTAANGDSYSVVMTSSANCASPTTATSNQIVITVTSTVTSNVTITAIPGNTICPGTSVTFTASPNNGGTVPTYEWIINGASQGALSTNETFTSSSLTNGDQVSVRMTSNAACVVAPGAATSNVITMIVNPAVTPSVSISAFPSTMICAGTSITITATPTNGGQAATYVWRKNATIISGISGATYTTTDAMNGDSYDVVMTSNASCVSPLTATSNAVIMSLVSIVNPTVFISTPAKTICAGTSVTFTANPGNGGTAPIYEWFINGTSQGAANTTATLTTTALVNGDVISARMTSNSACAPAPGTTTSNDITMIVNPVVTPSVSISATATTICAGANFTLTATPLNGGPIGMYVWRKNGTGIMPLAMGSTYTTTDAVNGDSYDVVMTSHAVCVSPTTAISNAVVITVNPAVQSSVTISANQNTICTNGQVTFTATPTNGGTAPIYEWSINAVSQGAPSGSPTFTTTALTSSSDVVRVTMTSNAICVVPNAASASMSINVSPGIGAGTIGSSQTICYNTIPAAITQLSAPTNIVGTATYTWEISLNGAAYFPIVGYSGATYIFSSPLTQDLFIRKVITDPGTPAPCNVATSNAIKITVRPQLIAGIIEADETICIGTAASTITQTTAATGGTGTYTHQWESSVMAGGPYANVAAAGTGTTYSPGVLTTTMFFRRIETSGICGSVHSNEVAKIVTPRTVPTIHIDDPGQTCDGDIVLFKCQATTVGSNPVYNWYVNNNMVLSHSPSTTNSSQIQPFENGDEVWVEVVSNSTCADATPVISNKVIVELVPCTVSSSIYTTNNIDILLQPYVSNSNPNTTSYTYFWAITDGSTTTSVNTSMAQAGINLFPNPTTESFNIEMPESGLDVSYEILDVTGARVANGSFTSTGSAQKIDAHFGAGMYHVVLHYNNIITCARLSKLK